MLDRRRAAEARRDGSRRCRAVRQRPAGEQVLPAVVDEHLVGVGAERCRARHRELGQRAGVAVGVVAGDRSGSGRGARALVDGLAGTAGADALVVGDHDLADRRVVLGAHRVEVGRGLREPQRLAVGGPQRAVGRDRAVTYDRVPACTGTELLDDLAGLQVDDRQEAGEIVPGQGGQVLAVGADRRRQDAAFANQQPAADRLDPLIGRQQDPVGVARADLLVAEWVAAHAGGHGGSGEPADQGHRQAGRGHQADRAPVLVAPPRGHQASHYESPHVVSKQPSISASGLMICW